jgi:hypothetical protein
MKPLSYQYSGFLHFTMIVIKHLCEKNEILLAIISEIGTTEVSLLRNDQREKP